MSYSAIITILLLLFSAGCSERKEEDSADAPAGNVRVPVQVSTLNERSIEATVTAVGSTEALRREKVVSPVAGRILSINALEGSHVHRGDVLVTMRTREAQSTVDGAQSLLRSAVTERQKQEAEHALRLADSLQSVISMRANFDGVVVSRNVAEGELVSEQAELLSIIDPSTIMFVANAPLKNISEIHPQLMAHIRFTQLSPAPVDAVVEAVSAQADVQSQSVNVRLRFRNLTLDQQRQMKANVAGVAQIITGIHRHVLCVPRPALLHDDEAGTWSIAILTADSLARIIPVTVGIQDDSLAEVHSELLHNGQSVIISGQYALTDSVKVIVERP